MTSNSEHVPHCPGDAPPGCACDLCPDHGPHDQDYCPGCKANQIAEVYAETR